MKNAADLGWIGAALGSIATGKVRARAFMGKDAAKQGWKVPAQGQSACEQVDDVGISIDSGKRRAWRARLDRGSLQAVKTFRDRLGIHFNFRSNRCYAQVLRATQSSIRERLNRSSSRRKPGSILILKP